MNQIAYPSELFGRKYMMFNQHRAETPCAVIASCELPERNKAMAMFAVEAWAADSNLLELSWHFNNWSMRLTDACIWMSLMDSESADDRWLIQLQFVDPLLHYGLLQPSSHKDRLVRIAAQLLHQANLCEMKGARDWLEEDDLKPGKHLTSNQRIKQLGRLGRGWEHAKPLLEAIKALNTKAFRTATADYRNEACHFIPPRIGEGFTHAVKREVFSAEDLPEVVRECMFPNGSSLTAKHVRYVFVEQPPLELGTLVDACREELSLAAEALSTLNGLVLEIEKRCSVQLPHLAVIRTGE